MLTSALRFMSSLERHIHRLPGQQPKVERKVFPVGYVPTTMEQMDEIIIGQFSDYPKTLEFYRQNIAFYTSFFNARLDVSQHKGSERFNRFVARYAIEGSRFYKPERFSDDNKPILDRINLSLFPNRIHRTR